MQLLNIFLKFIFHVFSYSMFTFTSIFSYISSSSSCRTTSTDFPDPLSPLVSIFHRSRQVFQATSCIRTELLKIGSSWGRPTLASQCKGVRRGTSLMKSSPLLQQCPACLVRLIWMVFEMGGWWWPYSYRFGGCCIQNLFNKAGSILVCNQAFSPYA